MADEREKARQKLNSLFGPLDKFAERLQSRPGHGVIVQPPTPTVTQPARSFSNFTAVPSTSGLPPADTSGLRPSTQQCLQSMQSLVDPTPLAPPQPLNRIELNSPSTSAQNHTREGGEGKRKEKRRGVEAPSPVTDKKIPRRTEMPAPTQTDESRPTTSNGTVSPVSSSAASSRGSKEARRRDDVSPASSSSSSSSSSSPSASRPRTPTPPDASMILNWLAHVSPMLSPIQMRPSEWLQARRSEADEARQQKKEMNGDSREHPLKVGLETARETLQGTLDLSRLSPRKLEELARIQRHRRKEEDKEKKEDRREDKKEKEDRRVEVVEKKEDKKAEKEEKKHTPLVLKIKNFEKKEPKEELKVEVKPEAREEKKEKELVVKEVKREEPKKEERREDKAEKVEKEKNREKEKEKRKEEERARLKEERRKEKKEREKREEKKEPTPRPMENGKASASVVPEKVEKSEKVREVAKETKETKEPKEPPPRPTVQCVAEQFFPTTLQEVEKPPPGIENPVAFYQERAKKEKKSADAESDKLLKVLTYFEAGAVFTMAVAVDAEQRRVGYGVLSDVSVMIKDVTNVFLRSPETAASSSTGTPPPGLNPFTRKDLSGKLGHYSTRLRQLSMRTQAVLAYHLFQFRATQTYRSAQRVSQWEQTSGPEEIKDPSGSTPKAANSSTLGTTPSPSSSTHSEAHQKQTMVAVPQTIYQEQRSQLKQLGHLMWSHRIWKDAREALREIDGAFIDALDRAPLPAPSPSGPLCLHGGRSGPLFLDAPLERISAYLLTGARMLRAEYEAEKKAFKR